MAETTKTNGWGGGGMLPSLWMIDCLPKRVYKWSRKGWNTPVMCLCGFGGGRNGVTKVAAILQQQCFWSFIFFLCCVLDGTCFSSCRLSWDSPAYLKPPLFLPLFLSTLVLCFYVIVWNVKKENIVSSGFMVLLSSVNSGSYSGP